MEKQIIIKDLLVSYQETAGENERVLLFLHGWRSNKEAWDGVIKRLKDPPRVDSNRAVLTRVEAGLKIERLGIVAIDLPGFGRSQTPKMPMTVGDYAEAVAEFIKKLGLQQVTVIGHSFGGRVGIKLSSVHPDLISKLVLVDSAGFAADESKKSLMSVAAKIAKPFFKPAFMQPLRKKIYQSIGAEDYVATPELKRTFVNVVQEDLSQDMKKIVCPTLIVYGENDKDTPLEFGKRMSSLISNSEFLILKNAGHFSFIDKAEEFVEALSKFIES